MALDFPSPASTGTAYTGTNGIIYIYDGIKWVGQQPNLLGHLLITGQTISGTDVNGDIVLAPNGEGSISIPGLKIPVGTIVGSTVPIVSAIADLTLSSVIDHSTGTSDALVVGQYGITNGIPAPWAVYEFTTNPSPVVQIDDVLGGAGIPALPYPSIILSVGTGTWSNTVIAYSDFSTFAPPIPGIIVTVARATTHASMNIDTDSLTDINLNVGVGGKVVTHGSILPYDTNTVDIGSPAKRFRKLWLGGGTIYVLDETLGTDQAIGARDGNLYVVGGAGLNVGEFTLRDNTIQISNPARDIILGTTTATGAFIINRPIEVNTTASTASFTVDRTGRTSIRPPTIPANDIGALSIIGSSDGSYQTVTNPGGMLHITGNDGQTSRVTNDAFGTGAFSQFIGRAGRGTASSPIASQTGDILARYAGLGWIDTTNKFLAVGLQSPNAMEFTAAENFTPSGIGTKTNFYNAPIGGTTRTLNLQISTTGLTLPNAYSGITYPDSTRQTTAWTGTIVTSQITNLSQGAVTKIVAGSGITISTSTGEVGIDATGVQTVQGTTNQIIVTDSGSKNLTLRLPQSINTTASVTFQNITVNNLTILGTSTIASTLAIEGKIIYLATSATNADQIDGGGIVLGTSTFTRSILYSKNNDWWDTDGAGLKTLILTATTATVDTLEVLGAGHFGTSYLGYDFANAEIQADANINSYSQIIIKNHNSGTNASSDLIAANDIGTDENYYIDVGINSSGYSNPAYSISGPNEGYLYVAGSSLSVGTVGTDTTIKFFTSDATTESLRATITDYGMNVVGEFTAATINGYTLPNTSTTAGWVLSNDGTGITSWVMPQSGYVGSRGNQGIIGFTGSTGYSGSVGFVGSRGIIGFTGSQGINGTNGFTGSQGIQGVTGFTGSQGVAGSLGYTGSVGYTGSQGIQGVTGFTGSQGIQGTQGITGFIGSQGIQGITGFIGSFGFTGSQGYVGSIGYIGSVGYTGSASSVPGPIGYIGSMGYTGSSGGVTSLSAGNNVILTTSTGAVSITRIDGLQNAITGNSTATYIILTTDQYFGSTRSLTGGCTVTLPVGSSVPVGRQYIIKDEGGQSGTFGRRITLTAAGSDTIDGSVTRTITSDYGALTVLWTGTRWSVI